ncbi:MAG: glycerol-3-phosphate acyltransferase [Clostridia bacterium]|jgi:glycerol-3-phosphate acyltransferase PlsY|nr:glycerol-3-phosphate acyltransferase [Clostridia bacterium]
MEFRQIIESGFLGIAATGKSGTGGMLLIGLGVLICAAAGYFTGSISPAIIISKKLFGTDIRELGSGNAGMTNMFRTFGRSAGLLTLAGDAGKTVISVAAGYAALGYTGSWVAGLFCVLGHMFPVYYRFRGGKGVLVCGVMLLLTDPLVFVIVLAVFAAVLVGTRMVSMASVMSALTMPLFLYGVYAVFFESGASAGIRMPIAAVIAFLVVFGHRENIKRIKEGKEPKIRIPFLDRKKK